MKNRNVFTSNGTVAGSPVTVTANFEPGEWQITNRSVGRMLWSFGDGDIAIPAGQGLRVQVTKRACTVDGTGDYEIEAVEASGSLDMA
jgi:hypothetical protein